MNDDDDDKVIRRKPNLSPEMNSALDDLDAARAELARKRNEKAHHFFLSAQELVELRHFFAIVTWIRSEQRYAENAMLPVHPGVIDTEKPVIPPVMLINENLRIDWCEGDIQAAQQWWKRINEILKAMKATDLHPRWYGELNDATNKIP